jgi:hypothetical protein
VAFGSPSFQRPVLCVRTSVSNHNVAGRLNLNYILAMSTESSLGLRSDLPSRGDVPWTYGRSIRAATNLCPTMLTLCPYGVLESLIVVRIRCGEPDVRVRTVSTGYLTPSSRWPRTAARLAAVGDDLPVSAAGLFPEHSAPDRRIGASTARCLRSAFLTSPLVHRSKLCHN